MDSGSVTGYVCTCRSGQQGGVRLSGVGHSPYCFAPHRLPGIRRNRIACPPQVVSVNRVIPHKYRFDYERAIGRRVLM
jgi:hypothetical protein